MSEETVAATIQIGDLLVKSGLIAPELLDEVNRLAFKMRLPIGRILTTHGHITPEALTKALEMQARIRDMALPVDHGARALRIAVSDNISLDSALQRVMPKQEKPRPVPTSNRLGEILMAAGFASPKQVEEGLQAVADTGLPLGMVLYARGIITRTGLNSALAAQKLIRLEVADRDKIIYALKNARLRSISLRQSLTENNIDPSQTQDEFGIGELLVLSGAISESQLMTAKEIESVENKPITQVIVELGFASEPCVQATTHILKMIREGVLFENQAAQIVKKIQFASSNQELNDALASLGAAEEEELAEHPIYEVTDILRRAGLLSDKELQIATALSLSNRNPLLKTLLDAKLVDRKILEMVSQCKTYLDHSLIQMEQATIAITYALDNNLTIDETLDCFGWSAPEV
ncbi:MAG: hypothetical protein JSS86_13725 [Cyanobacteria bacterium SZAS LIN-2]|nr:hypothetical protein [Cyanobacteria bacterium SZAS LIN-3]MBS1997373.1 hypothetical protein [Cyanobacteria bacterium SZAS LIN-2]MBS2005651.1 hypothetical protein [Cyanobacteria bacterium SZAS TMP-1]